ncbi:hypothetical protein [Halotalea alkalilenta]|nr:hypothetical protein [Halotalea alkalilenta]
MTTFFIFLTVSAGILAISSIVALMCGQCLKGMKSGEGEDI